MITKENLNQITPFLYEISKEFRHDMRVPARVFLSGTMLDDVLEDRSLEQLVNVATLPGIKKWALAMPDIHQGYGFPIGGVAGFAINEGGIISPGGIGYDINCGVRLLTADLKKNDLKKYIEDLATDIFFRIPSGVGRSGKISLSFEDLDKVLNYGAHRMVELGLGNEQDIEFCQDHGYLKEADANLVSEKAKKRGHDQLGTLGSGNHFLEIQEIDEIFDDNIARAYGLEKGNITIMIHCGSRGLGHQTCTDYVKIMLNKLDEFSITLPDKELACAPFNTNEGQNYYFAMAASANFAWANRHLIGHNVRESFKKFLGENIFIRTLYDISHNIGKKEIHNIDGIETELLMHRKGATRAFGPNNPNIPLSYRHVGEPVLIPGTMGTASYVLAGTENQISLASSCHGAGRKMSRLKAKKIVHGKTLKEELESKGIIIRCDSNQGLAEEAPIAYKDVDSVVDVIHQSNIAKKVAKLIPIAVIKGG